jgi:multidrug efflux pump subunit AcrB
MLLSANSDTLPLITVEDYAENFLAAQIAQVSGVSQVLVFGQMRPAIRIQGRPWPRTGRVIGASLRSERCVRASL